MKSLILYILSLVSVNLSCVSGDPIITSPCKLPLDIFVLQDTTQSFMERLDNARMELNNITKAIVEQFPGSRVGLAEFRDKIQEYDSKILPCYKRRSKLTADLDRFVAAYSKLDALGGGDKPENSYQALINAAKDPNVGWRVVSNKSSETDTEDNKVAARIIILITDMESHKYGDVLRGFPRGKKNPGNWTGDTDTCLEYEYPSKEQVIKALTEEQITLVILTPSESIPCESTPSASTPSENDKIESWTNLITGLSHTKSRYDLLHADMTNFKTSLLGSLQNVAAYVCPTEAPPTSTSVSSSLAEIISNSTSPKPGCPQCHNGSTFCGCPAFVMQLAERPSRIQISYDNVLTTEGTNASHTKDCHASLESSHTEKTVSMTTEQTTIMTTEQTTASTEDTFHYLSIEPE